MTDAEILAEFNRIAEIAGKTPQGADYQAITATVAAKSGRTIAEVSEIVLDDIFMRPN